LERIHDASQRIEKSIHAAHPEVGSVLIHFEPT
jgi:divalent metal cation (Fe/Co/Zn/Cd) transporter